MKIKFSSGLCWLWITFIVLLLDRVTKYAAQKYLLAYYALPVIPGFNLMLSFNRGAAFSFLSSESGWQVWFFGLIAFVVSIGILCWLARLSSRERWVSIALSFIIGGALGNLFDRAYHGFVVDFIDFYVGDWHFATFNIADCAICIGAALIVLEGFLSPSGKPAKN